MTRSLVVALGLLLFVGGTVLAFVLFHGGGGAPGLFGGCGLAAFGLLAAIGASDGDL